jgi:phospholipid N-methyltransferase
VDKLSKSVAFSGQYLIAFMPFAPIDPVGLSKKDYKQQCDDYLLDNSPCLVLYVYSLNLN